MRMRLFMILFLCPGTCFGFAAHVFVFRPMSAFSGSCLHFRAHVVAESQRDLIQNGDHSAFITEKYQFRMDVITNFQKSKRVIWYGSLIDRKSTRLNSSHVSISYAVFCLKKKK